MGFRSGRVGRRRWATVLTGAAVALASHIASPFESSAQEPIAVYPEGPRVTLVEVGQAAQPVGVYARAGDPHNYVIEKAGRVRALAAGANALGDAVLDLSSKVSTTNERGLFALAIRPNDPTHLYVTYAATSGAFTLSEFSIEPSPADAKQRPMAVNASSERIVLQIPHPNDDHYGGAIAVDPNNNLLVSVGDGGGVGTRGGVGDRLNNAQNLTVLLGKILRIDPTPTATSPYTIPADNPFLGAKAVTKLGGKKARGEIWAYGLRNPWRMTRDGADQLWIADVGQSSWEEVNRVSITQGGLNFGWKLREGLQPYKGGRKPKGAVDPVFAFAHDNKRCAVIGGAVVTEKAKLRALTNSYVFGDLCSGRLMALTNGDGAAPVDLGTRLPYLVFLGPGADGTLYATSLNGGVYRIDAA